MHRAPIILVLGFGLLSFAVACSDSTTDVTAATSSRIKRAIIDPSGSLDKNINDILSLLPKGLETAATTRWGNVKAKYYAGVTDPAQAAVAKQMLFDLSNWVSQKAPGMADPPDGESKSAAAARAVLYMSMFVYSGPDTKAPAFMPLADAAFGVVTPSAPATIVTPTTHAGVQLEAGSVAENTIIVVTENPDTYRDNCSGPLQTRLCQYPEFYTFEEFPHRALVKPAKFNVCHVNSGSNRAALADHDRFRLAHPKPANPDDYTPGSKVLDQNGESIEILPLVPQTFSTCGGSSYGSENVTVGPFATLSRFAGAIKRILAPKTAYAIDVGLGGLSRSMSPFNDVDSLGRPDLDVVSFTGSPSPALPGSQVTLAYSVENLGTATNTETDAAITVQAPSADIEFPSLPRQIGTVSLGAVAPRNSASGQMNLIIPQDLPVGNYDIALVAPSDVGFQDSDVSNNRRTVPIEISEVWRVQESGGWHAVWTRTPSGDFNGAWESDDLRSHEFFPMTYVRTGNSLDMVRTQGNACHYTGTIAADGLTASGTEVCPGIAEVFTWNATIGVR